MTGLRSTSLCQREHTRRKSGEIVSIFGLAPVSWPRRDGRRSPQKGGGQIIKKPQLLVHPEMFFEGHFPTRGYGLIAVRQSMRKADLVVSRCWRTPPICLVLGRAAMRRTLTARLLA